MSKETDSNPTRPGAIIDELRSIRHALGNKGGPAEHDIPLLDEIITELADVANLEIPVLAEPVLKEIGTPDLLATESGHLLHTFLQAAVSTLPQPMAGTAADLLQGLEQILERRWQTYFSALEPADLDHWRQQLDTIQAFIMKNY